MNHSRDNKRNAASLRKMFSLCENPSQEKISPQSVRKKETRRRNFVRFPVRTSASQTRREKYLHNIASFECELVEWSRETPNARRIFQIMFSHLWYIMQTSQHVDNIWVEHGMIKKASVNTKWWNVQKSGGKMMLKWSCYQRRSGNKKRKDGKIKKVWVELSVKFLFCYLQVYGLGGAKSGKIKTRET